MKLHTFARFAAVAMLSAGLGAGMALAEPVRKGEGERRRAQTAMELKTFPDAFGHLSDWTNGARPTTAEMSGKPVLIVTYASWYDLSVRALRVARRMSERFAADGLVVIGVHHAKGWNDAEKMKAPEGATFLLAHDAQGEFRRALLVSNDPEFFVIDRSGQLRFANIANESVEEACTIVAGESQDSAAGIRERLAAEAEAERIRAARTRDINTQVDLTRLPEIPFIPPPPEAYERLAWPVVPRDPNQGWSGQPAGPRMLVIPDTLFIPKKPAMAGRAYVVYFWHPTVPETYDRIMGEMDILQRQHGRDLVVLGAYTQLRNDQNQFNRPQNDEETDPEKVGARISRLMIGRKFDHTLVFDAGGAMLSSARPLNQSGGGSGSFTVPIPYAAVASSDGVIRWTGRVIDPGFKAAIDRVLAVDPAVKARRAAEEAYIREIRKPEAEQPADGGGGLGGGATGG